MLPWHLSWMRNLSCPKWGSRSFPPTLLPAFPSLPARLRPILVPIMTPFFLPTHDHSENKCPGLCFQNILRMQPFLTILITTLCSDLPWPITWMTQIASELVPLLMAFPIQWLLSMAVILVHCVRLCSDPPVVSHLIQSKTQSPQNSLQGSLCLPTPRPYTQIPLPLWPQSLPLQCSSSNSPGP